jgi:hypothetical protein
LDAEFEEQRRRAAAAKRQRQKLESDLHLLGIVEPPEPAPPVQSAAPRAPEKKPRIPQLEVGYSKQAAEKFLPPNTKIYKEAVQDSIIRWRIYSPLFNNKTKSRTRQFGGTEDVSDFEAMSFVLQLAWFVEECSEGGTTCPWDFEREKDVEMKPGE